MDDKKIINPIAWKAKNYLANRRKTMGQVAVAAIVGRFWGITTLRSTLNLVKYRADWASLHPEQVLKLKVLLQAKVDLTADQVGQLLVELGGIPDVRTLMAHFGGQVVDYGLAGQRLVTDGGVGFIVDAFQNLVELENMKFHGFGTGTNAENQTDSALQTELTTEYAVNSTRVTGTTTEGATANIYRTVATLTPDSGGTIPLTEHAVFSANTGSVPILDRTKYSVINVTAPLDSLQATYELTLTAGS